MDLRSSGTDVVIELVIQVPVILRTTVMSRQLKNVSIKMKHSTIIKTQKHFEDAYLYYYQVYHLVHMY